MPRAARCPHSALRPLLLEALLATVAPGHAASPADSTRLIARARALFRLAPSDGAAPSP
jgi:hypothetical protein